jgi:small neutral amino acid transporter SnatA (MarC family)
MASIHGLRTPSRIQKRPFSFTRFSITANRENIITDLGGVYMGFEEIDLDQVLNLFILLLIGMGPKIALVPFLDVTSDMDGETKKKVASVMVRTGVGIALLLVVLGGFLMHLLHFTPGAIQVAGGIVLLLIGLKMVASSEEGKEQEAEIKIDPQRKAMELALYPLAVPYLLNPAGIAVLIIASGTIDSIAVGIVVVGLVLLVGLIDMLVFRYIDVVAKRMDQSRLVVTEAVFGVLFAAVAVQLFLEGLQDLGIVIMDVLH